MNQYQIEKHCGIDAEVAKHMMSGVTSHSKNAMNLLRMCVNFCEPCSLELLKEAVADCKKEMKVNHEKSSKK